MFHTVDKPVLAKLEEELMMEEEEPQTGTKAKTRLRILVVEDEIEIKAYLKSELSDEYKVETCNNGKEAYDLILRDAPDLVISDVMMPEMDGFSILELLRSSNIGCANTIPVIALTARVDDDMNYLSCGFAGCIRKPFSIDRLFAGISGIIGTVKDGYGNRTCPCSLPERTTTGKCCESLSMRAVRNSPGCTMRCME